MIKWLKKKIDWYRRTPESIWELQFYKGTTILLWDDPATIKNLARQWSLTNPNVAIMDMVFLQSATQVISDDLMHITPSQLPSYQHVRN